jgi:exodeoxyribonuclease V alpha subunit
MNQQNVSTQTVSGIVQQIHYFDEESGFCIFKLRSPHRRQLATVKGNVPALAPGQSIDACGEWKTDARWGEQFLFDEITISKPTTKSGILKYLSSGMIPNIGEKLATQLVDIFGERVFEVIRNQPHMLETIPKIGRQRRQSIVKSFKEHEHINEVISFLFEHGLGTQRAATIYQKYKDKTVETLSHNPYILMHDIQNVGFKTADTIAQKFKIHPESPLRIKAGIRYVVDQLHTKDGYACVEKTMLIEKSRALLNCTTDLIEQTLSTLLEEKILILQTLHGSTYYYPAAAYHCEKSIAKQIGRLLRAPSRIAIRSADNALTWVQQNMAVTLSTSQQDAVKLACLNKAMILTGGPGTGKTFVTRAILTIMAKKTSKILCAAPTGMAGKRLETVTGFETFTIHRLLKFLPRTRQFEHNENNPLDADLVVIDESSMMDMYLFNALLKAVPAHARILIIGDHHQLQSIGAGNVLSDLITSQALAVAKLTDIFRQAKGSAINVASQFINQEQRPQIDVSHASDFTLIPCSQADMMSQIIAHLVHQDLPAQYGFNPKKDIQVLTAIHRGDCGTIALNQLLQATLNGHSPAQLKTQNAQFRLHDKVIQTRTNYDLNVFNGESGQIIELDPKKRTLVVQLFDRTVTYTASDLSGLLLSYAITVHKSQGSEYPCVVMPIPYAHVRFLTKTMLYTGVTRAKQKVVLLVETRDNQDTFNIALHNTAQMQRATGLVPHIQSI